MIILPVVVRAQGYQVGGIVDLPHEGFVRKLTDGSYVTGLDVFGVTADPAGRMTVDSVEDFTCMDLDRAPRTVPATPSEEISFVAAVSASPL